MNIDDRLIKAIISELDKQPAIEKAVLFGSRARGDNSERSDYDIAVFGSIDSRDKSHLRYVFDEELPTLNKMDLVFYNDITSEKFKNSIDTEGIVIYGKAR